MPITAPLTITANHRLDIDTDPGSPGSVGLCDQGPFKFNRTIGTVNVAYPKRCRDRAGRLCGAQAPAP